MSLFAHAMKWLMLERSSCPPSCWRQASSPSSKPVLHGRHLGGAIVIFLADVARAEQTEDRAGRDGGHVAALLVEPVGVALFRDAVADEGRPRRAERDELVRIDRKIVGVFAAEGGFGRAVLEEIAGHPVIFAGAGEVFHGFAEIATVRLGAAFAG